MKAWDSELGVEEEEEEKKEASNGTSGRGEETEHLADTQAHLQKVQKLIYAAKVHITVFLILVDKNTQTIFFFL